MISGGKTVNNHTRKTKTLKTLHTQVHCRMLTWVTHGPLHGVPFLQQALHNPRGDEACSPCHTHRFTASHFWY
jgi:hypothetical protein